MMFDFCRENERFCRKLTSQFLNGMPLKIDSGITFLNAGLIKKNAP